MSTLDERLVAVANEALQAISARATIDSFTEDSVEAENINRLYVTTRDHLLGSAWWGFGRVTETLSLIKSAPGTPENPSTSATQWNNTMPAPPWFYEYRYPVGTVQFHYVVPQPLPWVGAVPIFSTTAQSWSPLFSGPPAKFVRAVDANVSATITAISRANPGVVTATNSFTNGDRIIIADVGGMIELNSNAYAVTNRTPTTFTLINWATGNAIDTTNFSAYTSGGYALADPMSVILTNCQNAIGCFTSQIQDPVDWSPQFRMALIHALAGFLAIPLTGDKELAKLKISQANALILEARAADGNEGLAVQNYTPETLRVRGYVDPAGLVFEGNWFAPYFPLFQVN